MDIDIIDNALNFTNIESIAANNEITANIESIATNIIDNTLNEIAANNESITIAPNNESITTASNNEIAANNEIEQTQIIISTASNNSTIKKKV